jgi:hypothetical protein
MAVFVDADIATEGSTDIGPPGKGALHRAVETFPHTIIAMQEMNEFALRTL